MPETTKKPKQKVSQFQFKLNIKTLFLVLLASFFTVTLLSSFLSSSNKYPEKPVTQVMQDIKAKKIKSIVVDSNKITTTYKNGATVQSNKETNSSFLSLLQEANIDASGVAISVKDSESGSAMTSFLSNLLPTVLMIAFFIFLFRQARGAQDSVFSFGQAKSKKYSKEMSRITFADVAGVNEAKKELEEIVDFLKNPKKYQKLGARSPKGVLLFGPAGTGKTLLAKAVAGESSVPFFSIAGSEFMEMLVGIGAARVRDLFATAKKEGPAIIFIDEVDAIGRTRSQGAMPAHDEREQTLNQILVEMDGFSPNDKVIVIAATNRGDLLDPALLRPGRFDRRIILDYPDVEGREAILKIHAKGKPFDKKVSWDKIAKRTVGFSGADIENMLNEAAIAAARQDHTSIFMADLEEAATKVKLGPEKKRLQTDADRNITAYHEAGHAIVTYFQPNTDPIHRISIVSRGMALGFTLIPPKADRLHETKTHLLQMIVSMMGGRAAEETVFGEITTGASNDFDQATKIARAMVVEYGMSKLGPVNYGPSFDVTQWGRQSWEQNSISESVMGQIDAEVKSILEACYTKACDILKKNRKVLDKVAAELVKKESLDDEEFLRLVGKK